MVDLPMIYLPTRDSYPPHKLSRTPFRSAIHWESTVVPGKDDVGFVENRASPPICPSANWSVERCRVVAGWALSRPFGCPPRLRKPPTVRWFALLAVLFCKKNSTGVFAFHSTIDGRTLSLKVARVCGFATARLPTIASLLSWTWVAAIQLFVLPFIVFTGRNTGPSHSVTLLQILLVLVRSLSSKFSSCFPSRMFSPPYLIVYYV